MYAAPPPLQKIKKRTVGCCWANFNSSAYFAQCAPPDLSLGYTEGLIKIAWHSLDNINLCALGLKSRSSQLLTWSLIVLRNLVILRAKLTTDTGTIVTCAWRKLTRSTFALNIKLGRDHRDYTALALENGVANLRIALSQPPAFTIGGSRDRKLKALPFRLGRVCKQNIRFVIIHFVGWGS